MFSKKNSVTIAILATSILLESKSNDKQLAFIDIEIIRQTEKAILVQFITKDGEATKDTDWLPLKACTPIKLMGNDVYKVVQWFNEVIDHDVLNTYFDRYGYTSQIG